MTTTAAYTVPGTDGIAHAYAEMRHHHIAPLVARDWLVDQVHAIARDDIDQQVDRNHGAPAAAPAASDEHTIREIYRALTHAVAVYNRQRGRATALDHVATDSGVAAINRAAVARTTRTNDTERALLIFPPHIDTFQIGKTRRVIYVSGILRIGTQVRAISARFLSTGQGVARVRLTHFDVLIP